MSIFDLYKRISKSAGPGVITGVADDDPSGIATYAQTGAIFGYSQLWLALFTLPFMIAIQEMCGRIGLVTGSGLAQILKRYYSKKILYGAVAVLVITNIVNIGADLGAMSSAVQLVLPFSFTTILITTTVFTILTQVLIPYRTYVTILKYFALTVFAYVLAAFFIKQDWYTILFSTIVPHVVWSKGYLLNMTAMLGTTISPYLFFWQTSEEVEEELLDGKLLVMGEGVPPITNVDISQMRSDTAFGMLISNIVTFFIIITAAGTLGKEGLSSVTSATQVASSLEPLAGKSASLLFTLGIVGTGLLAIPVLAASAGYAIAEAFGWKEGLGKTFNEAKGFYIVIILSVVFGVFVNLLSISPITMLYYAAILNGLLAPLLMILIILIGNNKNILGKQTNGWVGNMLGMSITCIMSLLTLYFLYTLF